MKMIKLYRIHQGLTQIDLARKSGIAASKLSLIECGHINPSPEEIQRIATALGISKKQLEGNGQKWDRFLMS
jgi:transcriptional regulator with XRE-family HTH domain